MRKPTVGSLFSGIGGLELGLERAGFEVRWQVEIDDFCTKVLTKHWPDVPKFRDIKALTGDELEPVDLICGGFPCQPFSVAGKQRGSEDDRYLWPEMLRIIEAVRPTWCLLENVPGIIRMALDGVLSDLEALSYATRTFVVPACAVNAPHRRDRVWVVAYADSTQRGQEYTARSNNQGRDDPNSLPRRKKIPSGPSGCLEALAYSDNVRQPSKGIRWTIPISETSQREEYKPSYEGEALADARSQRRQQIPGSPPRNEGQDEGWTSKDHHKPQCDGEGGGEWRPVKSPICRVAHGLSTQLDEPWSAGEWPHTPRVAQGAPDRVNRLKALGNSVVPQLAEVLGRMILEAWKETES